MVHKNYCDVLLLKQLLPDICQAAGDFCFLAHHACALCKSTELLRHKTPDFTRDVASQQTRTQFCRLQIIDSHSGMRLLEITGEAKRR